MASPAQLVSLAATALTFLAIAGGIFVFAATMISQNFGSKTIWPMAAICIPLAPLAVAYKMSGVEQYGLSLMTGASALHLLFQMLGLVGIPLALGAVVLKRLSEQRPQKKVGIQMATSWGACLAAMPLGFAAGEIVNGLYYLALKI